MTYDQELFKKLDKTVISKVRIGNGAYLSSKGQRNIDNQRQHKLKINF
jgi:hypothetical protein